MIVVVRWLIQLIPVGCGQGFSSSRRKYIGGGGGGGGG